MTITAYRNFNQIITLNNAYTKDGRNLLPSDLDIETNSTVIFDDNKILWIGQDKKLPQNITIDTQEEFSGHILLPEIVDSHTHLVFGGDRAKEYMMRLNGG